MSGRWLRRKSPKPEPYPCRGPIFTSARDAYAAIREASIGRTLVEQPIIHTCADRHWHIDVRMLPRLGEDCAECGGDGKNYQGDRDCLACDGTGRVPSTSEGEGA